MNLWTRAAPTVLLVVGIHAAFAAGPAVALDPDETPFLYSLERRMRDIGAQLQNSKIRLSGPMMGAGTPSDGRPDTPMTRCCTRNLETIARKMALLRASIAEMDEFYRGQHNRTAASIVGQMFARLNQVGQGVSLLEHAPTQSHALEVLGGLIRPFNEFRNGVQVLDRCCPLPLEPPQDPTESSGKKNGSDGKDGKKKKKSESDSDR